jgi:S-adenosylmethionine:tRNA ribosyltransferase-isomerase
VRNSPRSFTANILRKSMRLSEFDYHLPSELIAQQPLAERDASRMLVLDRATQTWTDSVFRDFTSYVSQNDVVVVNNSRVIPARLKGRREETGGQVEILLVRELEPKVWEALVRPGGRLKKGSRVVLGNGQLSAELTDEPGAELRRVRFHCDGSFDEFLEGIGVTPLPPYIKRSSHSSSDDRERYQTVYAKQRGAIAAPTAGLHFTPEVLAEIEKRASFAEVTLHVGYGTFEPVRVDDVNEHAVSAERFEISEGAAEKINHVRTHGGRVIVVGTTTMRALESAADQNLIKAGAGEATLTIKPGYKFRVADALLTNFHLPQSSLLILASAFAGREFVLHAYRHAVEEQYRFYSYGDCMLIL